MAPSKTQSASAGQQPSSLKLALRTPRLEIIAATLPLVEAELAGPDHLAASLQAEVGSWPPPLNDENSLRWTYEKLTARPEQAGFFVWYIILVEQEQRRLIRSCGAQGAARSRWINRSRLFGGRGLSDARYRHRGNSRFSQVGLRRSSRTTGNCGNAPGTSALNKSDGALRNVISRNWIGTGDDTVRNNPEAI
jgi:hypothetical protein